MPTTLYSADVLCPMTGPPVAHGGVLVSDDRVAAVGEASPLRREADREHHVDGVLLPGLVNGHTHLELTRAAVLARPGPHHVWAAAERGITRTWTADDWQRSAREGVLACLRAGTTCVGDVVRRGAGVPAAARAGLLGDSFVEVDLVDRREQDAVLEALRRSLSLPAGDRRVGVGPSAAWALGTGALQSVAALAAERDVPLQVHGAHTQAEVRALWHGDGPLADLVRGEELDAEWLDGGTEIGPIRYLAQVGALRPGASVVHGVWADDREAALLAEQRVAVVSCPRAEARMDAGDAPMQRYARAGTPLALGTESLAAVDDLDVLAEAAAWVELARRSELALWPGAAGPVELAEQAVRFATVDGAAAMGWGSRSGVVAVGRRADLVGVEVATTPTTVYADVVDKGPGRQVLTVLAGVRRARRGSADEPWPPLSRSDDEAADE